MKILRDARKRQHMSLRDLERASGVSNAAISQIEQGQIENPGFFTIVAICKALRVDIRKVANEEREAV